MNDEWVAEGKKLRQLRLDNAIGLSTMAQIMNVAPFQITQYENGTIDNLHLMEVYEELCRKHNLQTLQDE